MEIINKDKELLHGTVKDYFLSVPNRLTRDSHFLKWISSKEGAVWLYLQSYVKRVPENINVWIDLYQKYYIDRNELAARWSLDNIALNLDTSKSRVIKCMNSLVKKGFVRIDKYHVNRTTINVYVLGKLDEEGHSKYFAFTNFIKDMAQRNLNKFKAENV